MLHNRSRYCFDRSNKVIQTPYSDREDLLMHDHFENPIEYCSSTHVSINSKELYSLVTTVHANQFLQKKDVSFDKQNSGIGIAYLVPMVLVDKTSSFSHRPDRPVQPSCIDKDPFLAHEHFENVLEYSSLAKAYMKSGQLQSFFNERHKRLHLKKKSHPLRNKLLKQRLLLKVCLFKQQIFLALTT